MRARYDPEVDILYLRIGEAPIANSETIEPNLVVDRDAAGKVVGIEVLWVSTLEGSNPLAMAFEIARSVTDDALVAQ